MPADVFKKPSWEPTTAQPFIVQPFQSSVPPTPPEEPTAAISLPSDQDDMFLISAAASVSRPPAPTTHPSALRPSAPQRPSVPATSVDDRNILFWRDRMTAQEEERNKKGFRPAFSTEQASSSVFHANISEENIQELPETSSESVASDQAALEEHAGDVVTTDALSKQQQSVPVPTVSTRNSFSKQPVVGDIQVQFWRDRMNEQEEARNRHGFRKPLTENTEMQVTEDDKEEPSINGVNGAHHEEESSSSISDNTLMESSDDNLLHENDVQGLRSTSLAVNGEGVESIDLETAQMNLNTDPTTMETIEDYVALSSDDAQAAQLDGQNPTFVDNEAIPSVTDEEDLLVDAAINEVSSESMASLPITEADQVEEIADLKTTESSFSEPSVVEGYEPEQETMESTSVNGEHDLAAFDDKAEAISTETDHTNGLTSADVETIAEHLQLESGVHLNGDHNAGEPEDQLASTSDVAQPSLVTGADDVNDIQISSDTQEFPSVSDQTTMESTAPINAKSSTKELLQYLFTGSPDGSDQLTDETVSQYLADPSSVLAKLNGVEGTSFVNGDRHHGERTVDDVTSLHNGKSDSATPSTEKLLDILFGVTEDDSVQNVAEVAKSSSNGLSEPTDKSESLDTNEQLSASETQDIALLKVETPDNEEDETEKDKLTSTKVREMALFTLKELLLQDRQ
ncbi:hypothetical protein FisN_23Hh018 [Fistulifera solaris]|uniref:Uncharacterized protein n=1 Tax=Fistulifera solaris TaxID=1519565 RepID=A0A1Z5KMG0_FISSO|nr:hypothetical protein FisN_23Hh018 [Fistulifera solaris]|eukprot:GAX27513.1 hypothetical protein FisN_23Hh018 [Fistulifera solaris]